MNSIGFLGNRWCRLLEGASDILKRAIWDDNLRAISGMYGATRAIADRDMTKAVSDAKRAETYAKMGSSEKESVQCPFCKGTGEFEVETESGNGDLAICVYCKGNGSVNVSKLVNDYPSDINLEDVTMAILNKDYQMANRLAMQYAQYLEGITEEIRDASIEAAIPFKS